MRVNSPDPGRTRAKAADWFEISVLAGGGAGFGYDGLLSALELQEHSQGLSDDQELEIEILESRYEEYCDSLLAEVEWRERVLGEFYPFKVVRVGPRWRAVPRTGGDRSVRAGRVCYLVCLLISGLRYGYVDGPIKSRLESAAPDVFQVLAWIGARGLVGGPSFWMGHPRPESDGFADALARFVEAIGVGAIKTPPPPSQQGRTKDAGVDVIAWRTFADHRPAPIVVYGQVASGAQWRAKPVTGDLDSHFLHWMSDSPSKHYIPAIYIPFVQHENVSERVGADFEEVARDESMSLEKQLGVVVDRLRLTELIASTVRDCGPAESLHIVEALRWTSVMMRGLQGRAPHTSAAA
jgi:hypothetical protein